MKTFPTLLLVLVAAALLASCHKHHDDTPTDNVNQRTVIVYASAENNLSDVLPYDLAEMEAGSRALHDDQRLVAFVDNTSLPYIVEFRNGSRDTIRTFSSDFYASDPARFREVIEWIEQRYPTADDNYALVLWGHATGWLIERDTVAGARQQAPHKTYGQDNGNNRTSQTTGMTRFLNITQMARALQGLPRFRYILCDCCCMMCAEVAYELRHATDYLIGSPAEIPADGAPYDLLCPALFSEADDFYTDIVDTYYDYYLSYYQNDIHFSYLRGNSVPLSVVDMSRMDDLAQATRNVLRQPSDFVTDSIAYYFHQEEPVMYDMEGLMERNLTTAEFESWKAVFDRAVPYRRFSAQWMTMYSGLRQSFHTFLWDTDRRYGGLSLFVPNERYAHAGTVRYNDGIRQTAWYEAVGWQRFGE